jgi:hypothetical protein
MTDSIPENATQSSTPMVQMSQGALDGLVGNAKREAAERERTKLAVEYEAKMEKMKEQALMDAEVRAEAAAERKVQELEKKRLEQLNAKQLEDAQKQITEKLAPKFKEGGEKFSDWKDTVLSYDWHKAEYAEILPLLAQEGIDNADEVLHHLCSNGHVEKLASRNKTYVMAKLKEMSESIKTEKEKPVLNVPPEPIRSLKPSHVKTKGDSDYTIEDFRKAKWLKG